MSTWSDRVLAFQQSQRLAFLRNALHWCHLPNVSDAERVLIVEMLAACYARWPLLESSS